MALSKIDAAGLDIGQIGGRRNLIINGAMQVAQRGTSFTGITSGTGTYTLDRYDVYFGSLGTWTVEQSTDSPNGFSNSLKCTATTADASPAAGDYAGIVQFIEAQNLQGLGFGTADAKSSTLSFWVKSNKTGTATLEIRQDDNSSKSISPSYTINSADTWEYKTISVPADTAGVINNDNGIGFQVEWWLNSGSTYTSGTSQTTWTAANNADRNAANLGVGGATSDYFAITGVQLEVGSVATPFEHRSYGEEFLNCCRYYQECRGLSTTAGYQNGTSQVIYDIPLFVPLRAQPTVSYVNRSTRVAQTAINTSDGMGTTFSGGTISNYDYADYMQDGATLQLRMNFTSSVGGSDNTPIFIWPYHTMQINSEL